MVLRAGLRRRREPGQHGAAERHSLLMRPGAIIQLGQVAFWRGKGMGNLLKHLLDLLFFHSFFLDLSLRRRLKRDSRYGGWGCLGHRPLFRGREVAEEDRGALLD